MVGNYYLIVHWENYIDNNIDIRYRLKNGGIIKQQLLIVVY